MYDGSIQALLTDNAVELGYNENEGTGAFASYNKVLVISLIIKSLQ